MHVQLSWDWNHLLVVLVIKIFNLNQTHIFLCPPAACIPSLVGCPLLVRSTLVTKNCFISQTKPFHVSTEACNLQRCTHSCPCKVPGPLSWVLDAIDQPGLSLSLAGAVSMELSGPRGQYGDSPVKLDMSACCLAPSLCFLACGRGFF